MSVCRFRINNKRADSLAVGACKNSAYIYVYMNHKSGFFSLVLLIAVVSSDAGLPQS